MQHRPVRNHYLFNFSGHQEWSFILYAIQEQSSLPTLNRALWGRKRSEGFVQLWQSRESDIEESWLTRLTDFVNRLYSKVKS